MAQQSTDSFAALNRFERRYVRPRSVESVLIVGSRIYDDKEDRRRRYSRAVGVDAIPGPGVDMVLDMESPLPADMVGRYDHVECMSVLEHSRRPWLLAANIELAMRPGGTLHVQVPFVWRVHNYPGDYWRFTADGVKQLFSGINFEVVLYASKWLSPKPKVPRVVDKNGDVFFGRTEVCGFGTRRD